MIRLRPRLRSHQKISGPIVRESRAASVLCSLGTPLDPHKYLESPNGREGGQGIFFSPPPPLFFGAKYDFLYLRTEISSWKPNPAPGGKLNGRPAGCEQYRFGMKSFSCPVPRSDPELHPAGIIVARCRRDAHEAAALPGLVRSGISGRSMWRAGSGMRMGCGTGGPSHPKILGIQG